MNNSKIIVIVLFVITLLSACKTKKDEIVKPNDLLSEAQMVQIIYDIHMVDGLLTANVLPKQELYNDTNLYYSVFVKNNVDREIFDSTVKYYVRYDFEGLNVIYDKVLEKYNRTKGELEVQ